MRVPQALALIPPARAGGKGISIGHPDSGYTDHFALGLTTLDRQTGPRRDQRRRRGPATRSSRRRSRSSTRYPTLATARRRPASSSAPGNGAGFQGVATGATLVPIRATESVVQVFDSDVAKAVRWARTHGCHVVSMSLGGKGFFGFQDAIQEALDAGMIVLAAAGNQVGFVTAPASYDNCIAVAATGADGRPWSGSSHGGRRRCRPRPGACVWAALFDWQATPRRCPAGAHRRPEPRHVVRRRPRRRRRRARGSPCTATRRWPPVRAPQRPGDVPVPAAPPRRVPAHGGMGRIEVRRRSDRRRGPAARTRCPSPSP